MPFLEKQLYVRRSSLPRSGKGLFTKKPIPSGCRIVEYKGSMNTWNEVDQKAGFNGYIYYIDREHVVDASRYMKALGRYANDAKGLQHIKGIYNNAAYVTEGFKVYIESIRPIVAGAEILVAYGKEYWDVIRHNQKIAGGQKVAVKRKMK
jgi:uncharacterized protein